VRFGRFALSGLAAVIANEIAVATSLALDRSASTAAATGWLAGVVVSYVLARWAFERKGRHLLAEWLPFVAVSVVVLVILTLATRLGSELASALDLHDTRRIACVVATNFAANCVTFLARFMFFHRVLFARATTSRT
jgi:putative flippase GtrA